MKHCKICNSKADKTGSHLVPHFLMKRIDSEEGKKGRDKEMGFVISEKNLSSYFGRGTSEDKLNEVYGEINEERINSNQIPLLEDYIFCNKCEKHLADLESNYSKSINQYTNKVDDNYLSKVSSKIATLFWVSIMFRLSIAKNLGVRLITEHEEILKNILNDYFSKNSINADSVSIKYKLFRSPDFSLKNSTILHINPEATNPYLAVIDEYVIVFSIDNEVSEDNFYGINLPTNYAIENNIKSTTESIYNLHPDILSQLNQTFFDKAAKLYRENLFKQCDSIFAGFNLGSKMPSEMKEEIFNKIASDENISFGDKYTIKHKANVIFEVISKNLANHH